MSIQSFFGMDGWRRPAGFSAVASPPRFGGSAPPADVAERRQRDDMARRTREMMPLAMQMVFPIGRQKPSPARMARIIQAAGSYKPVVSDPQLFRITRSLEAGQTDAEILEEYRRKEKRFLADLGVFNDLLNNGDADVAKALPAIISQLDSPRLADIMLRDAVQKAHNGTHFALAEGIAQLKDPALVRRWGMLVCRGDINSRLLACILLTKTDDRVLQNAIFHSLSTSANTLERATLMAAMLQLDDDGLGALMENIPARWYELARLPVPEDVIGLREVLGGELLTNPKLRHSQLWKIFPLATVLDGMTDESLRQELIQGIIEEGRHQKIAALLDCEPLSGEQRTAIFTRLLNEPLNPRNFPNGHYQVYHRMLTSFEKAPGDDLKASTCRKLADCRLEGKWDEWSTAIQSWAVYQITNIESDALKVETFKSLYHPIQPENRKFIHYVVHAVKDPAQWLDIMDFLKAKKDYDAIEEVLNTYDRESPPPADFTEEILAMCESKRVEERYAGLAGLFSLRDRKVAESLARKLLEDSSVVVRQHAYRLVFLMPSDEREACISRIMKDPNRVVSENAVLAIPTVRDAKAQLRLIRKALQHPRKEMRYCIPFALINSELPQKHRQAVMLTMVEPDNPYTIRTVALKRLEDVFPDPSPARDAVLAKLAGDPDPRIREKAAEKLELMLDDDLRNRLAEGFDLTRSDETRKALLGVVRSSVLPSLQTFNADHYAEILTKPFDLRHAERRENPTLEELLPVISLFSRMGRDGGELQTHVLPEFKKLLQYSINAVNRNIDDEDDVIGRERVENFFRYNRAELLGALSLIGGEPLKVKMTQRLWATEKFLEMCQKLATSDLLAPLVYQAANLPRVAPEEVLKVAELVGGFHFLGEEQAFAEAIQPMLEARELDVEALGRVFLRTYAANRGLAEDVSPQDLNLRIEAWDLRRINTLASSFYILEPEARIGLLEKVIKSQLKGTFDADLLDKEFLTGEANRATRKAYEAMGLSMPQWLGTDEPLRYERVRSFQKDTTWSEQAGDTTALVLDEAESLIKALMGSRRNGIAGLVDDNTTKTLFTQIRKSGFTLQNGSLAYGQEKPGPKEAENLLQGVHDLLQSRGIWQKARRENNAGLNRAASSLDEMLAMLKPFTAPNPPGQFFEWRIWDRNPATDLFLGSDTDCCVAMDSSSSESILRYITNHSVQILELRDAGLGKRVGVAFLAWIRDERGQPCLLVDNVEIDKSYPGKENETIRNEMTAYLRQYAKAVSGRETPILLGKFYNDIPCKELPVVSGSYQFVGHTQGDTDLHLDAIGQGKNVSISDWHEAEFYRLA